MYIAALQYGGGKKFVLPPTFIVCQNSKTILIYFVVASPDRLANHSFTIEASLPDNANEI